MLKEDLRRIKKIQLKMDRLSNGLFSGLYLSHFKGKGIEFEEVREFQQGDEVRSIDWNVTARMGSPFVKIFREERELTLILMMDISASMLFGSRENIKRTFLSEIAAVFAFSAIKNRDRVGLILFTDGVEHYVPPGKGAQHVLRLIRDLMAYQGRSSGTDLKQALTYLGKVQKKRAVAILLSDFIKAGTIQTALAVAANKHDFIALAVQDPMEKYLSPSPLLCLQDLESGEQILVDPAEGLEVRAGKRELFRKEVLKAGGSWIDISTDLPYLPLLYRFLMGRKKR